MLVCTPRHRMHVAVLEILSVRMHQCIHYVHHPAARRYAYVSTHTFCSSTTDNPERSKARLYQEHTRTLVSRVMCDVF